jgi:hypothetical protein
VTNPEEKITSLKEVLKVFYSQLASNDKKVQAGAGMCLTRVIQNAPPDVLIDVLPQLSEKVLHHL